MSDQIPAVVLPDDADASPAEPTATITVDPKPADALAATTWTLTLPDVAEPLSGVTDTEQSARQFIAAYVQAHGYRADGVLLRKMG